MAYSKQVNIRFPLVLLARIDSQDGERSAWILEACRLRLESGAAKQEYPDTKRRKYETCDAYDGSKVDSVDQMQSLGRPRTDHSISIADDVQAMPAPRKVDTQDLRDICAGKTIQQVFKDIQHREPAEIPICGHKWWEEGEFGGERVHYECLMDKGHKNPKHGQNGMVRRLDD